MEIPNTMAGGAHRGFRLARTQDGVLRLFLGTTVLPVNEANLERLIGEHGLVIPPGGERLIASVWAIDALEEALASVGHSIASAEVLKRRLLFYLRQADGAQAPDAA